MLCGCLCCQAGSTSSHTSELLGCVAAADVGKCALCAALRWRATRACCVRVRAAVARASVCAARAPPVCAVCCALLCALFMQLGGAGLAGRAARRAAACCGWSRACLMVCGGRSARPPGSSAAQGAGMRSALHVRLCARLARMFPCGEGRAYVFTLRARAGAEGGAVSPRSDAGWSSACRGRARKRPCRVPNSRRAPRASRFFSCNHRDRQGVQGDTDRRCAAGK